MSTTPTPRSARLDLPHAPTHSHSTATDTGLAEWTNKIKAMQRQVDADDEAEQRRLEEEITRARLARMRRSRTGQSGDFGVGMHGIDLSKLQEGLPRTVEADLGISSSDKPSASIVSLPKPAMKSMSTGAKSASMSLAAFMGGNASGPRLRRHEPQLDASLVYDGRGDHGPVHPIFGHGGVAMPGMIGRDAGAAPPSASAPTSMPQPPPSNPVPSTPRTVPSEPSRARTMSTSNVARRYVDRIEEQASGQSSSPKPLGGLGIRERRQSTPHGSISELKVTPTTPFPSRPLSQNLGGRAVSPAKSPFMDSRPKTPAVTDARPKTPTASEARSKTPVTDPRTKAVPVIIEVRSKTPSTDFPTKTTIHEPRAKTPGTDITRVKTPIQSSPTRASYPGAVPWQTPRHQPSPQLPSTSTIPPRSTGPPSPIRGTYAPQPQRGVSSALLRPPISSPTKDPTPSISRLQGRGFVQSIVQASDRFSGDTQGSPSTTPKHVFPSTSPAPSQGGGEVREKGARRASVLDRWTPVMNGIPSPPLPTTKSATPTRSYTAHASMKSGQGQDVTSVKTHDTGRSVRSVVSLPAIPKTPVKKSDGFSAQDTEEKLGSSSTRISYIKPAEPGDDPIIPNVDELGVKALEGGVQVGGTGTGGSNVNHGAVVGTHAFPGKAKTPRVSAPPLPPSPGKPLSHPTKDRAKKPRKARFEEGRLEDPSAVPVPSTTSTEVVSQSPDPAVPSSTGPASSPPDTSSTSFGPKDSQSGAEPLVKITERWTEPMLIGVKSTLSSSATDRTTGAKPAGTAGMVGRRALSGLANSASVTAAEKVEKSVLVSMDKEERTAVPPSPTRHTRIPSTGNRALVMEVAQALNEAAQQQNKEKEITAVPASASVLARQIPSTSLCGPATEKRKSSFERYSAIAMPPLAEERTPAASPANTTSRSGGKNLLDGKVVNVSPLSSLRVESTGAAEHSPSTPSPSPSSKVHIDHVGEPLPKLDIAALLKMERPAEFVPNPDLRTVSVEVMSVVHTNAVPVQRDINICYDAEVLVIVHRAKSRESGLVATKVWCWKGKKCLFGEKEERKVGELARRYGTSADVVDQQREPAELVYVLGGQLATRQGTRAHWSCENTAMHVVRSNAGHILIDEIDLDIRNLCSGYSYCISILDTIYVWHGCGSVAAERTAGLRYAQVMAAKGTSVKELMEGENDGDDEMFWMVVGDSESYAKADYWRWRSSVVPSDPCCWLVDIANSEAPAMAPLVAASKPFSPTVHVLVLPTQLPLDMRHAFRNLDEFALNGGFVPDHMNILSTPEAGRASAHVTWDRSALRDHTMLPLDFDSLHAPLP
ncbi:hypothetical protein J3R82DRAFT_10327 [Butyriboletus roseoflavus]|nr:hypothetical protein J3R82DRAFT_10327 [Butyriboletus roseoflavus]